MKASKQTRLKLKKGFHNAPIKYTVLAIAQLSDADMKEVAKGLIIAQTPSKAEVLLPKPGKPSKWQLHMVTALGDYGIYALRYKGLEVAVFHKRRTSEVIPDPSDPVPEGVLENPDDVWARMDLITKSPRQLVGAVADDLKSLQLDCISKDTQIEALNRIVEANGKTIATLQGRIKVLEGKTKK